MIATEQPPRRGRPPGIKSKKIIKKTPFNPNTIKTTSSNEMNFTDALFKPMKTDSKLDYILSSDGGLMPATNMVITGGSGSGKSTLVLDLLSKLTLNGYKVLYIHAEMDEIGHYKYCKRNPQFANIEVLFLQDYEQNTKEVLEHYYGLGYDVIAHDSLAEITGMIKDNYGGTESAAEGWLLRTQARVKKGQNKSKKYTTMINIQQVTKGDVFVGSNRIKHMTDAMAQVSKDVNSGHRKIVFDKNRDSDMTEEPVLFQFSKHGIFYSYPESKE